MQFYIDLMPNGLVSFEKLSLSDMQLSGIDYRYIHTYILGWKEILTAFLYEENTFVFN